jgi:hypothetical protein
MLLYDALRAELMEWPYRELEADDEERCADQTAWLNQEPTVYDGPTAVYQWGSE